MDPISPSLPAAPRRRPRRLLGIAIVVACAASTGLLVRRELAVRPWSTAVGAADAPVELAYALLDGTGRRVGVLAFERRAEYRPADAERPGSSSRFRLQASLPLLGRVSELDLEAEIFRPAGRGPVAVAASLRSAGHDLRLAGEVVGGELVGHLETAGERLPLRLPVKDELLLGGGLGPSLELPRLATGEAVTLTGLDPLSLEASRVRVRAVGHETLELAGVTIATQVLRVETPGLGSAAFASRAWVDAQGLVVRAETPLGLVLERLPAASAFDPSGPASDAGAAEGDLLAQTAVRASGERPFRGAREMIVRLSGVEGLALPEGELQTPLGDGRYRLTVAEPTAPAAVPPAALSRHLVADAFAQSDHPIIRRQARGIVGAEADPWRRAVALHDWVYERLDKEPVMSLPSALEVLAERRGDCNEHTVLYAALARAAGLPTRIAVGLVWSDELDGFYYHAWPEVHVGRWLRVDPTLGQPLGDATHLKLVEGGVESWPRLLPWLGRIAIDVEEVR